MLELYQQDEYVVFGSAARIIVMYWFQVLCFKT
jgi:hypothetical protein